MSRYVLGLSVEHASNYGGFSGGVHVAALDVDSGVLHSAAAAIRGLRGDAPALDHLPAVLHASEEAEAAADRVAPLLVLVTPPPADPTLCGVWWRAVEAVSSRYIVAQVDLVLLKRWACDSGRAATERVTVKAATVFGADVMGGGAAIGSPYPAVAASVASALLGGETGFPMNSARQRLLEALPGGESIRSRVMLPPL